MNEKILFQVKYNEDEGQYEYITNEMTNQEFRGFVNFLNTCYRYFVKELDLEAPEVKND